MDTSSSPPLRSNSVLFIRPPGVSLAPEILLHLFKNIDSRTLRTIIPLVCRQWLSIVRNDIQPLRIFLFAGDGVQRRSEALGLLSAASALELRPHNFKDIIPLPLFHQEMGCQELMTDLALRLKDLQATNKSPPVRSITALGPLAHYEYFSSILPYIGQISVLQLLRSWVCPTPSILNAILKFCPHLVELRIEGRHHGDTQVVDLTDVDNLSLTSQSTTSLKVLSVQYLQVPPGFLESIIEICPELIEFKIERALPLQAGSSSGETFYSTSPYPDVTPIINLARTYCRQLRLFHFSICNQPYTLDEVKILDEQALPFFKQWSLPDYSSLSFQTEASFLTYLELTR